MIKATLDDVLYPLYHESGDTFSDATNESIVFKRNEQGKITGYILEENGTFYSRLNQ